MRADDDHAVTGDLLPLLGVLLVVFGVGFLGLTQVVSQRLDPVLGRFRERAGIGYARHSVVKLARLCGPITCSGRRSPTATDPNGRGSW